MEAMYLGRRHMWANSCCPRPITLCTLFAMSTNGSWKAIWDRRSFAGIKGSKAVHSIVNTRSSFRDMGSTDVQAARMEAGKSSFNQEIKCCRTYLLQPWLTPLRLPDVVQVPLSRASLFVENKSQLNFFSIISLVLLSKQSNVPFFRLSNVF